MTDSVPAPAPSDTVELAERVSLERSNGQGAPLTSTELSNRYEQQRLLGEGAMGAVYLVRDRDTGEQLALKKLFRMDPRTVLRLKREFRSLANLSHPNLVRVHELSCASDGWYLAMEYVDGQDFHDYLGIGGDDEPAAKADAAGSVNAAFDRLDRRRDQLERAVLPAFRQLARGVHALHRAGMLHRDLKPSNVMVSNHRVLVLDFGLVRELDPKAASLTEEGAINGTPAYMAPEQALGKELTEASDWYAFGVMLFEALTGELPFDGPLFELIRAKLEHDPPSPAAINGVVPKALDELCLALLSRDPTVRPSGAQILSALEPVAPLVRTPSFTAMSMTLQTETHSATRASFFGREAEIGKLYAALDRADAGQSVLLHVRGVSGAGKTALIEEFLEQLEERAPSVGRATTLVLRSRCYEREAMPFKALDGVIDALCRHLTHLDDVEVSNLLPGDIAALAQLFPVLERLRAVQRLLSSSRSVAGAVHSRQRAEAALRELFRRLSGRHAVVVWIDDLQWGDLDSAGILNGWFQHGNELPVMFVLSYRADEVTTSPCLQALLANAAPEAEHSPHTVDIVDVTALSPDDVAALCRRQLGAFANGRDALLQRIVREAQGSPFLATQLAALAEAKLRQGHVDEETISVTQLVAQTTDMLSREARVLLCVLAVAGRPMAPKLAFRAAGVRHGGRELVHALRGLQLVRSREVGGDRLLEMYHDRVREGVQGMLAADEIKQLHVSLLATLEFSGCADPDWLYVHALGAGERAGAFHHGMAAAERAMTKLAFERAAELYSSCIELSDAVAEERCKLLQRLAAALDYCGRGSRAADVYLEASQLAAREESAHLMRLATSHLLCSGRFEEGEALLPRLLAALGHRVPASTGGLLFALIWERLRLTIRGLRYVRREASQVPPEVLARIDTFDALHLCTISIDPLRSTLFMLRSLRWALEAGEPSRVLNALGHLWYFAAIGGGARAERRADDLRDRALALAATLPSPAARAVVSATHALASFMLGRYAEVVPASYEAERLFREHATSQRDASYHMRLSVVTCRIGAMYTSGDYQAFAREITAALAEARATEDVGAQLVFSVNETLFDELFGRGELAVERLERQREQLPKGHFSMFHALHLVAVSFAACATGRLEWGTQIVEELWPGFLRSSNRRSPVMALVAHQARTRLWFDKRLKAGGADPEIERTSDRALADVARFAKGQAIVQRMHARLMLARGDRQAARALLQRLLEQNDTEFERERTRYLLAHVVGGEEGAAQRQQIEQRLHAHGVDHRTLFAALYPELFRVP